MLADLAAKHPFAAFPSLSALPETLREQLRKQAYASPDADAVLRALNGFAAEQPDAFARLRDRPSGLSLLIALAGHSRFLAEEVRQQPSWLADLLASGDLYRSFEVQDYQQRLEQWLGPDAAEPTALQLAQFRRQQLVRIVLRDVCGLCEIAATTREISALAEAILQTVHQHLRAVLERRYGCPLIQTAAGQSEECGFTILALGKLGGQELNYSSDIDLMFVYAGNGMTAGPERITNKEFFKKLANRYTELLSTYTAKGLCYRVDLRLRPDGRLGEVCLSLDGMQRYYQSRGRDWELQMLIKARAVVGADGPGSALLRFVEPLIYQSSLDFGAVEAVSETRQRMHEKLAAKSSLHNRQATLQLDVKLAPGGIRDIEFLVQCLQRLHGGREAWVRQGGTLLALSRLYDKQLLSASEYGRLTSAYEFLRHLEHRLQLAEDRQTHTLPTDPASLKRLARQMPDAALQDRSSVEGLQDCLATHLATVRLIYGQVVHTPRPGPRGVFSSAVPVGKAREAAHADDWPTPPLMQRPANGSAPLGQGSLQQPSWQQLAERLSSQPNTLTWLQTDRPAAHHIATLFEHSPWLEEQCVQEPSLIQQVARLQDGIPPLPWAGGPQYAGAVQQATDAAALRQFYRRESFYLLSLSVCLAESVFATLDRLSDLADAVIAAAYRMAVAHTASQHPPAQAGYQPSNQLLVIALGRLGMRECDIASDADLLFVLPDADRGEHLFWTRVAERLIRIVSDYTGQGTIFAVDTRLRPNGRHGDLVQTESAFTRYLEHEAEAWEGIAYMKSRAIAGNMDKAIAFLHSLQEVDWRRYGQSGRSRKDLWQMRLRLEKEQGAAHEYKAGRGGFYDIDFVLLYLRLKGAGLFFKTLNTPERIDIIEKMGHLERDDAAFLREAATFYRAFDHALRVYTGHADRLPATALARDAVAHLLSLWTPWRGDGTMLSRELDQLRERTRAVFNRLFAV